MTSRSLELSGAPLDSDHFLEIVSGNRPVTVAAATLERMERLWVDFQAHFAGNSRTYGLNTGFGPMVDVPVPNGSHQELQMNLVRSHAVGLGAPLGREAARAVLLARLQSLLQGHSAVRPAVVRRLAQFLSIDLIPVIPEHGGVGASGDLIQLAHVALALIGEGNVLLQSSPTPAAAAHASLGLEPLVLQGREGLALINGTSCMTGIGLLNAASASQLLRHAVCLLAAAAEVLQANPEAFSDHIQGVKQHPGQKIVARAIRELATDSRRMEPANPALKLQPHYSIRCVPQILGPVLESLQWSREVCVRELNSCSDNPVWDAATAGFHHGGNFHGDYVATAMDTLKAAVVRLQMLMERQLDYLLDDTKNRSLPPFLNYGTLGLELGLQGWQFTATSTTAESQSLAYPHRLHSISCNKDNQDIVSMGTNAAVQCRTVIRNGFEVAAILSVAVARAVAETGTDEFSSAARELAAWIDQRVPQNRGGATPPAPAVEALAGALASADMNELCSAVREVDLS